MTADQIIVLTEEELKGIKTKIQNAETRRTELRTLRKKGMEDLKKDFGVDNLTAARELLAKKREEAAKLQEELKTLSTELAEKYTWE